MSFLKFNTNEKSISPYHIDVAVENGDVEQAKYLATEYKSCPSLYAKQMARINGHIELADWMDINCEERNNTDIKTVHYNYETQKWADCIPKEHQY